MSLIKRALIVGVDHYYEPLPMLKACVSDAKKMQKMLENHGDGSPNFECKLLSTPDHEISRVTLRRQIERLFMERADVSLFYFAGHGVINNLGGYLVTQDYDRYDAGISMADLLTLANESQSDEVIIIIDCCKSGALGEIPQLKNKFALLREGVSIITATAVSQDAAEKAGGGIFTALVYEALRGGAADLLGSVTVFNVYTYVDQILGAWDQRPMFKSNMSSVATLRVCEPQIDMTILRKLPTYFENPEDQFQLDPSYEPDAKPKNQANEKIFVEFQKLRAKNLLEPVGEEHMYYAAMNRKSCRLTPLGRFYWRLAKDRKI